MKTKEFGPSKKLKAIWLISALAGSGFIGAVCAGIALGVESSGSYAFVIGFMVSLALIGGYILLYFPTIRYSVDREYVVSAAGVLWKVKRSIPLDKITNIDIRQGPLERLLGFGQIWIFTPSTGSSIPEEKLIGTEDPYAVKKLIMDLSNDREEGTVVDASEPKGADGPDSSLIVLKEILRTLKTIEQKMESK